MEQVKPKKRSRKKQQPLHTGENSTDSAAVTTNVEASGAVNKPLCERTRTGDNCDAPFDAHDVARPSSAHPDNARSPSYAETDDERRNEGCHSETSAGLSTATSEVSHEEPTGPDGTDLEQSSRRERQSDEERSIKQPSKASILTVQPEVQNEDLSTVPISTVQPEVQAEELSTAQLPKAPIATVQPEVNTEELSTAQLAETPISTVQPEVPTAPNESFGNLYAFPNSPGAKSSVNFRDSGTEESAAATARCDDALGRSKSFGKLYPELSEIPESRMTMRPFTEEQVIALYQNAWLKERKTLVAEFVSLNQEKKLNHHELYKLLENYLRSRELLAATVCTVRELEEDIGKHEACVWDIVPDVVTGKGRCVDNKRVTGEHYFQRALYNDDAASLMTSSSQKLLKLLGEKHVLYMHNASTLRIQIDYYFQVILDKSTFRDIPKNMPISAGTQPQLTEDVSQLRTCISVLFVFLRKAVQDEVFVNDVQSWLRMLASLLLRVASLADHFFLLSHVLRCPPGIHKWAISLVQVPSPLPWNEHTDWHQATLGCPQLDYALAALATILLPVEHREEYLQPLQSALEAAAGQDPWVVLDSDGEEDEPPSVVHWRENDVVALVNQVPFAAIFRHLLLVAPEDYDVTRSSEQSVLKLIAVASQLVSIFHTGLKTYNHSRNLRQQFAKEGRDLLSSLAQKQPCVVSVLLDAVDDHMMALGTMACYLMQAMPLHLWVPDKQDLDVIAHFLLYYPLDSPQSQLARLLIENLNYGFGEHSQLFLDQSLHQQLALLLLEAYEKICVPFEAAGYVYKQVRYLSYLATGTSGESSTPMGFVSWIWTIMFRLKLHAFDSRHQGQLRLILDENPPQDIAPDLEQCEWLHPIFRASKNLCPPAVFLSISVGSIGHYREQVLSAGLKLLSSLTLGEQFAAAVKCICHIMPLFYLRQEMLTASQQFLEDLQRLVLADNTYLAAAKSLVGSEQPGCVLKQLAATMTTHVYQAKQWGLPSLPIKLWTLLLFHLPDIPMHRAVYKPKGRENVMYLLDVLVQLAYFEADCFESVIAQLTELLANLAAPSASQSMMRTMFSYMLGSQNASWPAVVPLNSVPQFPWFALRCPNGNSVGPRFFESARYFPLLKKLKRRLNELADHCFQQCATKEGLLKDLCETLLKMYRTFGLWLEEPRLQTSSIDFSALPSQYCPEALCAIIQGNNHPWHHLVSMEHGRSELQSLLQVEGTRVSRPCRNRQPCEDSSEERIISRLKTYEGPMPAPAVPTLRPIIPAVPYLAPQVQELVSTQLKVLLGHASTVTSQLDKLNKLDRVCREQLLPALYDNVAAYVHLAVPCDYREECKGPLHLRLQYYEARQATGIMHKVEQNRTEWIATLTELQRPPTTCLLLCAGAA
ncbi:hypothetical protein MTO96_003196 [Rhipicephalus appendiculatus]